MKVPEIIPFRPTAEDKLLLRWLIAKFRPKNMSALIRRALQLLKEKEDQQ